MANTDYATGTRMPGGEYQPIIPGVYTGEMAYYDHFRWTQRTDKPPKVRFLDLSDTAIQGYEIAADVLNHKAAQEAELPQPQHIEGDI